LGKKPGHATEEVFEQLAAPAAHLFLLLFFLRTLNCTLIGSSSSLRASSSASDALDRVDGGGGDGNEEDRMRCAVSN
jgi:hypothetical protein